MKPEFTKIKETCLYISNLERSKKFYQDILYLPVISEVEGRHIFFQAGSSVLLCFISDATKYDKKLPPHHGSGALHFAFETSYENYNKWKEVLLKAAVPIEQEVKWGANEYSFYFRDPDHHLLEIVTPNLWT